MFNYGDKVKDKITGFEGVVTARIHHYGMRPDQYILESLMMEGYTYSQSVDENRLIPAKDSADGMTFVYRTSQVNPCVD